VADLRTNFFLFYFKFLPNLTTLNSTYRLKAKVTYPPSAMPKVALPPFPLSGLFGVAKPSGPTSMSVINDVKLLIAQSRIFVEADKLEKAKGQKAKRGKRARDGIKIGQGGTLDPLADGVLGEDLEMAEASLTNNLLLLQQW